MPAHRFDVPHTAPYDWPSMLAFLATRAIPGVEHVAGDVYRRTLGAGGGYGVVTIAHAPERACLAATVACHDPAVLPAIVARIRRVFDVDADVGRIGAHLSRDAMLATLVAARPGLRAPGGWDPFELAIRAVLGQQVTLGAARSLAQRLVLACGTPIDIDPGEAGGLTHMFPQAADVAACDLRTLGMPGARRATLHAVARAAVTDPALFAGSPSLSEVIGRLCAIPGVGEWTAQYVALRAVRHADAFPATDIGLLRAAADAAGARPSPAALLARAEAWRPFRAYAAQHLWAADAATLARARVGGDG